MRMLKISSFEGRSDVFCSLDELPTALLTLASQLQPTPTLVNVYDGEERIVVLGLGSLESTLQCVDKGKGVSSRALSEACSGHDKEFSYQGEATSIASEYLVSDNAAIRGAVEWLANGRLIPELHWRSREYPPQRSQSTRP